MSAEEPWRIILAAEGPSDLRRIEQLIDHLLLPASPGSSEGTADLDRLWRFEGLDGAPYITVTSIPRLAEKRGLKLRSSPDGPRKGDGGTIRALYQILQKERLLGPRTVIIWARDDDGNREKREHACQARESLPTTTPILLAIASECGEAWVIAGWQPETKADDEKLRKWRQKLGFEPHRYPERLAHEKDAPKSAKAVLADLLDNDHEKEASALLSAVNSDRGASEACGLLAFRREVETWFTAHTDFPPPSAPSSPTKTDRSTDTNP